MRKRYRLRMELSNLLHRLFQTGEFRSLVPQAQLYIVLDRPVDVVLLLCFKQTDLFFYFFLTCIELLPTGF